MSLSGVMSSPSQKRSFLLASILIIVISCITPTFMSAFEYRTTSAERPTWARSRRHQMVQNVRFRDHLMDRAKDRDGSKAEIQTETLPQSTG
jgi:hypothetical protein